MRPPDFIKTSGFRLGLAMAAVLTSGIVAVLALVYWYVAADLRAPSDHAIEAESAILATKTNGELLADLHRHLRSDPRRIKLIGLFRPDNVVAAGNVAEWPRGLMADGTLQLLNTRRIDERGTEDAHAFVMARTLPDGRTLVVGRKIDEILELRHKAESALALGLLPAIALSIGGGVFLGLRAQKRLTELRKTAERVMAGHLVERLPARGRGDDLDQLSEIVNRMLDEIEQLLGDIRGIGEDIAHDLRTPLTRVRARLERGRIQATSREELVEVVDKSIAGIDQALAIGNALLRIAEIEHSSRCAGFGRVELREIVHAVGELYEPVAEDKGLRLSIDAPAPCAVYGDRDLLMEAIANLVDNAVKFTPAPGQVAVSLQQVRGGTVVRVSDTGPGIAEDERESVFRRFFRSDKSRNSTGLGLGLNLVAAVAKQHGFALSIVDHPDPGCVIELACSTTRKDLEKRAADVS